MVKLAIKYSFLLMFLGVSCKHYQTGVVHNSDPNEKTTDAVVVRNCSGTYIQISHFDYKVCNEEILVSYEDSAQINVTYHDIETCHKEEGEDIAVCLLYHPYKNNIEILRLE